jgi:lipopolysaccharide biosynthesis glycosyltransferase
MENYKITLSSVSVPRKYTNAICFNSDFKYLKFAVPLYNSLVANNIKADLVCRCIDFTDDEKQQVRQMLPGCNLIFDNPNISPAKNMLKETGLNFHQVFKSSPYTTDGIQNMIAGGLYSKRAAYSCHVRFNTILDLLNSDYEKVLCLDCDTICIRDFSHIFELEHGDIFTVFDNGEYFMNEGLLMFSNNELTYQFVQNVRDQIFTDDNWLRWDADSEALVDNFIDDLKIIDLGYEYKDRSHSDDAFMWSGDALSKFKQKFKTKLGE